MESDWEGTPAEHAAAVVLQQWARRVGAQWRRGWALCHFGTKHWVLWEQCRLGVRRLAELSEEDQVTVDDMVYGYTYTFWQVQGGAGAGFSL